MYRIRQKRKRGSLSGLFRGIMDQRSNKVFYFLVAAVITVKLKSSKFQDFPSFLRRRIMTDFREKAQNRIVVDRKKTMTETL